MVAKDDDRCCALEPRMLISAAMFSLIMGCLLLAVFTSDSIPPYIYSRGFQSGTCVVQDVTLASDVCCQSDVTDINLCDTGYSYPCGVISVKYQVSGTPTVGTTLSNNTPTLFDGHHSASIVSPLGKCSYHHCSSQSYAKRLEEVTSFISQYNTTDLQVSCYYSTDKTTVTLLKVTTGTHLLHYILWPILLIIIGLVVWVVMVIYIKKVPPTMEEEAEAEEKAGSETTRALTAMTDTSDSLDEHHDVDYNQNATGSRDIKSARANLPRPATSGSIMLEDGGGTRAGRYGVTSDDKPSPVTYSPGTPRPEYFDEVNEGKKAPPLFRNQSNQSNGSGGKAVAKTTTFSRNVSNMSSTASTGKVNNKAGNFNRNTASSASMPEKGKKTTSDMKMTAID